jgi:hypothetical protein
MAHHGSLSPHFQPSQTNQPYNQFCANKKQIITDTTKSRKTTRFLFSSKRRRERRPYSTTSQGRSRRLSFAFCNGNALLAG